MNTNQGNSQFGQGSKIDERKKQESSNQEAQTTFAKQQINDDDILSSNDDSKIYPNNQNNPTPGYNENFASPKRGSNPNIGGDESEYETSTNDEPDYDKAKSENNDGFVERRDSEEINRHDDETRYSSATTRNRSEE